EFASLLEVIEANVDYTTTTRNWGGLEKGSKAVKA
ncbi:hypothetical protein KIPB_002678, partial [Kipferlia bialata]